jgi:hypothetical protein
MSFLFFLFENHASQRDLGGAKFLAIDVLVIVWRCLAK